MGNARQVVVIGGGVIGLACAHYLVDAGWRVTLLDRGRFGRACTGGGRRSEAVRQPGGLPPGGREGQVGDMFRRMFDEFGTIDVLVNNAGLQQDASFELMTLREWNTVLAVNLTGQFLCAREAVREFKRRGVRKDVSCAAGKIICVSSIHEVIPWAGHVN